MQNWLWGADGATLALALVAGVAEHRRHYRRDVNGYGWVPWRGLQAASLCAFLVFVACTVATLRT